MSKSQPQGWLVREVKVRRYQVFLQEREDQPHMDVGSVHAPDAEMALLNARDVFVRRPECFSLWVVPEEAIYSRTAEQLVEEDGADVSASASNRSLEAYYAFCKAKAAGAQTLLGAIQGSSPGEALQFARRRFPLKSPAFAWWVFPARAVTASLIEENTSFFHPALEKSFRMSTDFHTVSQMRRIKDERQEESNDG
jgi:ring-1,2-phenylacetyl-CoA epoxidase subunit PaaB